MLKVDKLQLDIIINNDPSRKALRELNEEANKIRKSMKGLSKDSEEYNNKMAQLADVERKMESIRHEIGLTGMSMQELRQRQRELNSIMNKMDPNIPAYKQLQAELKATTARINELSGKSKVAKFSISNLADGFNKYLGIGMAVAASLAGIIFSFKQAIDKSNEFNQSLAGLSSLTGLAGKNLNWLANEAKKMSASVVEGGVRITSSSIQILEAYKVIGSQRPELLKNKEALNDVTKQALILAEASGMELSEATKAVTNNLNQFNESSSRSKDIINAMAAGAQAGAGDIDYLSAAIEKEGTSAKLLNISIEDNIALIESIAPYYNEAAVAGNSLDKVLLKMKESGIGFKNGVFDINTAINELREKYNSGTSAGKIFGVEHAKMGELLVLNQGKFNEYSKAVHNSNKAIEMAITNTDTENARSAQAKNRYENMAIILGERLQPAVRLVTVSTTKLMEVFVNLTGGIETSSQKMEEERVKVNSLAFALMDSKQPQETRLRLYNELKKLAPDVVKGIDSENISIQKLTTNLEKYNNEAIRRIFIESKKEELVKKQTKAAEALNKLENTREELATSLIQIEKDVNLKIKQDVWPTAAWEDIVKEQFARMNKLKELYKKGELSLREYAEKLHETLKIDQYKSDEAGDVYIDERWSVLYDYKKAEDNYLKLKKISENDAKNLDELRKRYNYTDESTNTVLPTTPTDNTPNNTPVPTEEEEKKKQEEAEKRAKELNEMLNQIREDNYTRHLSEQDKEIHAVNKKYDQLAIKAKGHSNILKEIEINRAEELTDIDLKYKQKNTAEQIKNEEEKNKKINLKKIDAAQKMREFNEELMKEEDIAYNEEITKIDEQYLAGEISLKEHNKRLEEEELTHQAMMLKLRRDAGEDVIKEEEALQNKIRQIAIKNKENSDKEREVYIKNKEAQAKASFMSTAAAVSNAKSQQEATKIVLNSIRNEIKSLILEAVAVQVVKAIKTVPFPLNIVAAPAAGAAVSLLFDKLIPEFATGLYPVTGQQTGNKYMANYGGTARTGKVSTPTLFLAGEQMPEMIIDGPTYRNMQLRAPEIIHSIEALRVPQFASGKYNYELPDNKSSNSHSYTIPDNVEYFIKAVNNLEAAVKELRENGVQAKMDYKHFEDTKEKMDKIKRDVGR